MPKIYEYLGFIFFFYSNEHLPVHCHIKKGQKEMKVELIYENGVLIIDFKRTRRTNSFTGTELDTIESFIRKYHTQIVEKWTSFFVFGKKPTFEKIKRSIKNVK